MRSQIQEINIGFVTQEGSIEKKFYTAFSVKRKNLANTVTLSSRPEQYHYADIRDAIVEDGMYNPLIVMKNSYSNWKHATDTVQDSYVEPYQPEKEYLVIMGNQRLSIGDELGSTKYDVILVERWEEAVLVNSRLNWGYKYDRK